jgi:N6-L-threonylcarbamoyladenine synthase
LLFSSSVIKLLSKVDALAVTIGPGLIGSLLVGVNTAKSLAYTLKKPIIGINHLEGHIYANFINKGIEGSSRCNIRTGSKRSKRTITTSKAILRGKANTLFPTLSLIVSGGHTSLVLMPDHLKYKILGQTLDDAAGEAFDKVGKLLGLPYPGGPSIEKAAKFGNPRAFDFPRAMLKSRDFNFSFSGLKTAVLYQIKNEKLKIKNNKIIANLAASFQQAVIDILVEKTIKAACEYKVKTVILAGGVAANEELRKKLMVNCQLLNVKFYSPSKILCTDNAAMIAAAGYFHALKKDFTPWQKINADANLSLT